MVDVWWAFARSTFQSFVILAALAVIFTVAALLSKACNAGPAWWRKPDLVTDVCWSVLPETLYVYASTGLVIAGAALFYGVDQPAAVDAFFAEGHGPLAHIGIWAQIVFYLLGADLVMYVLHRAFHMAALWRFHAVHHSSEHLEWTSARRFHPVETVLHGVMANVVMVLLGTPPEVLTWMAPFNIITSALVHANLNWDFGPFRYLLVSPVYHRWHHTSAERGGSSNFASTFPVYDLLFGTFYLPAGMLPDGYGVDEPGYPKAFQHQLLHPFRRRAVPLVGTMPEGQAHIAPSGPGD